MSEVPRASTRMSLATQVLRPENFNQLVQFSEMAARSAMVPNDFRGKPENIMLAVQMGSELGLAPMQALQNIAVINGRPAVWGDAMLALCKAHDICEDIIESVAGDGEKMVATCVAKRVGKEPVVRTFSFDDAKQAGLIGKTGPWTQYRSRMLQMRARGFALRDAFPDVLRGLISAEEAQDIPVQDRRPAPSEQFSGVTLNGQAEPVTKPAATKTDAPKTPRQWFDELMASLAAATSRADVTAIAERADVAAVLLQDSKLGAETRRVVTSRMESFAERQPGEDG